MTRQELEALPEATVPVQTWAQLVCMHSILFEVCSPEEFEYETLTLILNELPSGDDLPSPFVIAGHLLVAATGAAATEFERMAGAGSGYIYEDEAVDLFSQGHLDQNLPHPTPQLAA